VTNLLLFGTEGCHLCEEAEHVLESACEFLPEMSWRSIDIADDEGLSRLYSDSIPVLREEHGNTELRWPFAAADICRFVTELQRRIGNHRSGETQEQRITRTAS